MKKVLWASRHEFTEEQKGGLNHIIGGGFDVKVVNQTFKSAEEIAEAAADCDYLAVVLPVGLLSNLYALLTPGQTIVIPKSKRVLVDNPDGGEKIAKFVYDGWEVIEKIIYVSHVVK